MSPQECARRLWLDLAAPESDTDLRRLLLLPGSLPGPLFESVVIRTLRYAIRFQQDELGFAGAYNYPSMYEDTLEGYLEDYVIAPSDSEEFENAMAQMAPSLFTLTRMTTPTGGEEYGLEVYTLSYEKYSAVQFNPEAVRSLWQAQVYELLYLGSNDSERGSIQQVNAVARNLINQA